MKVTFVLTRYRPRPVGGYLVVFRYANELVHRGHRVCVVHARRTVRPQSVVERSRGSFTLRAARYRRGFGAGRPPWFELDPAVEVKLAPDLRESAIPDADAVFATACTTAPAVATLARSKGTKLYLIQHYEDWACGKEGVAATWKMPLHKVVISRWLEELGVAMGEGHRMTYIPNGVELDTFRMLTTPAARNPLRVGMLAHPRSRKGLTYGVNALEAVRRHLPNLDATAFGAGPRPSSLPGWVTYVENPTRDQLVSLYNTLAIFLHTSESEGWPLPSAEAMACGCALVAADSKGVRDYAHDSQTALLVPPRDADALAGRLLQAIQDDALRLKISLTGHHLIQRFTWSRAADRMNRLLQELCSQ